VLRLRPLAVFLSLALALCLLGLWGARSQTAVARRVTNTTAEGLNLNPSLSGNGRRIAFETTEDVAGAGGGAFFRAVRADISRTPAAFVQLAGARAPAPGISQDGSLIAFAAKEDPLGTNVDGNSEIFLYNGSALRQITDTTPNDISRRAADGNYQPSLSDDGRFIAFSSNRNLTGQNSDGNFEIFVFDVTANSFSQLTNTAGGYGATDAKLSGDGSRVAYIKDSSALPAVQRDLMLQDRAGNVTRLAADNVTNLAMTYGRAISDDGARVVFAGDTAANSSQVFLYDARTNSARALTSLGARDTEVPLHPTISGDGSRVAFATRRTVPALGGNGDHSIELYTYDIPTGQFAAVTDAPSEADGFQGSTRVAEVVSSLSDDGSVVAFNFPRALSGEVETGLENNSEIYVAGTAARPTEGTLEILNGASFGHEPSTTDAVAPESYAVAFGGALSFETAENERLPDGTYPTTAGGTTVTVNNRHAQIVSVSPTRVDFLIPAATELGEAAVVVTNEEGFQSRGTIEVKTGAPGIFTKSGDGTGEGDIVNAGTRAAGPFDPTGGELRLLIFTTGVRNATEVAARAGGHALAVESVTPSTERPGTDEVRVRIPAELRGAGPVDLFVRADDRDSNPVTVTFTGVAPRPDIVVNEVLADPPADDDATPAHEGDANHDGVRDTSDDEFVELVNATGRDINVGGYQLFTRGTTAANDTLRHTFAPGTIFPAGAAIVVFGGGNFNPKHPAFGGAQVFKASEDGLSLVNTGGVVSLRDANQTLVTIFSYGGSTGLNGGSNQSLTRSPDVTGAFTLHTTAAGSNGSPYSPGTRVNGQPFTSPAIARIEVAPASAGIAIGQQQQFTATAYNAAGNPMAGVIFTWESSAPAVATIDGDGSATGQAEGTTQLRARARGVASAPATLTVRFVPRVLTGVEVSPATATIPVGGQQQFTARGLDQFGNEMPGLTFAWESTDTSVATVDQNGLASAVGIGTTTVKAATGGKTGTATLTVTAPKIVINEALADPPGSADTDLQGDANHDGERDSSQDEFVELVNSSSASVDISGWTIRTRSLDGATERLRHTFAAGTVIPANSAIVVFGGGNETFDPNNVVFGCAQVVKASSGRLSLVNSGETIVVTDASGNLTAQLTYGSAAGLNGGSNQSLTRSPDVTGGFALHTTAANSNGRAFSPGVKVDGTPFGNCPARLTSVTISPASQSVIIGRTTQFTAQARDQFGRPMKGVTITFTSDNTAAATVDSVTTDPATGIATATVRGRSAGTAHLTARATSNGTTVASDAATLNVTPPPPRVTRVEVSPSSATVNRGGTQKFTVKAFNGSAPVSGVTYTWTSNDLNVATVDQNGLATGVGIGTSVITATAPDGLGGTVSDSAALTVRVPLVINEILADVPTDNEATPAVEGDSNRDGVRSSGDDEFIEFLNNTSAPVDISGVRIADGTSNRFTIPAGTILAGGRALLIFGGGSPPADDPAFGGALVLKIPGTLSLNDTGDTVNVKLPVGETEVVIATQSYGSAGGPAKTNDQSLTRSPDAAIGTTGGEFVPHTTATNAAGRAFSPGTRTDGTPFGSPAITRIQVVPASATVNVGGIQVFTARAFSNSGGAEVEVKNVSFIWDATAPSKAAVAPTTGSATTALAKAGGSTMIRAQAGGQAGAGTLNINFPPVSRIEVTPSSAIIPVGGAQQFAAHAFDANNQEIAGVPFTWSSSNTSVATVDQNGLASGVAVGTTTVKASAGGKNDTATLNVVTRTVTINEVLADPPEGAAGDANRDGVRDSGDDEFVELVNALNTSVNVSGWTLRTRSETATTETVRHTFAANSTLPAGSAVVIFGGGSPNQADPAFGGAQVLKASTGRLSLTNSGLTIILRDASGNLVTQFTYGGTNLNAGKDQSLTRSPDITGDFLLHTQAPSSDGRRFSPGTRLDGTPFGSPAITRIQVLPASATVNVGATRVFTARAFSNTSGTEVEVFNVSFIWDSSDPARAAVSPQTGQSTAATALAGGSATIRARAGGQSGAGTLNVSFPPVSRIEVTPASATIPIGGTLQFTARAFDAGNNEITGLTFTWTSSNTTAATIDSNGLATGAGLGSTTITASAKGKSGTASLTVVARTITINEVLADPPEGAAGDANRDGVRDSGDDEFVELVNALSTSVNVSGWTLRTRSLTGSTETVRHTFAANTTLPAGRAIVLFGGGSPNQADPAFGGAQVLKVSTRGLSLTNTGLHLFVRDAGGNLVAQFTYDKAAGLSGDKDQSLTRSPDITGDFLLHTTAANTDGRVFSPGTRTDGTPFGSPAITRIEVGPAPATINIGGTKTYTARAFSNVNGPEVEVLNVSFIWDSSNPNVASLSPPTGRSTTATAHSGGSAQIRARAGGQAGAGTLNVNFPPVSRIEVTPSSATIPIDGTLQFTARAFDASNHEIAGLSFNWTSSNTGVATVDATGLATGVSAGTTTLKASAGGKSGTATLNVVTRTVTINEVLADPPEGAAGDANRDGVRDSADDEFVELVNALNTSVNVSDWTISTRSLTGSTETRRHTFAANTTLAANSAVVIFGGGSPNQADPAFGGAQVLTASTGRLSLTNSGLTIIVRDASGNLVTQFTYNKSAGLDGDKDQSLTRSPDITGDFLLHTTATNADGRRFSPGTRTDGTPFGSPAITRIQVLPASATVNVGGIKLFTARAFSNTTGTEVEVLNVSFIWDSSNPNVATVSPQTGKLTTATAHTGGSAQIRARAGGQAGAGTLNVNFPPVASIEVTPATVTIPVGGQQQFTARAFDASNNEIAGLTFTWSSSDTSAATVDQNGLATGVAVGTTTVKASAGGKNGTATLNVVARTITINEVLADPPEGAAGDANRDSVRDSGDDEFVELVNALSTSVSVSGWTLRTRSLTGSTETVRHTFAAGATLPAGSAVVIFGGGTINSADPAFGGAQVLKASTGRLSLTNSGLHVILRTASGSLVAQLTYGSGAGLNGDSNQSLTRSPDITDDFVLHTAAASAAGRVFSPGTRVDGTPFGSPPITRIEVTPASATNNIGAKRTFTARAFSNTGGPEVEVLNVSFIWDSSNPNVASLSPQTGKSTTATALSGGSTQIRARAGGQQAAATLNVSFPPVARIEVTPETATIPVGGQQQFTARAFDAGNNEITGLTFTWTSSNTSVATVDSAGLSTGVGAGAAIIKASAGGKNDTATLNVVARTVAINEILADPPDGLAGDANRDGVRDSTDDEFVELVNALNTPVNVSGWTIRTRSLSGSTETVRHTFGDGTTLPAGQAIVVFGGGTITSSDPAFGGAQVVTTSTSGLSLTNTGLHLFVRDASGNLVAQLTYGSGAGLSGDSNQSLTRSPDITGDFLLHTTAANADGRRFSPGTRTDGTPFGSPAITRIEITPATASIYPGGAQLFTARAYSNAGGPEVEVLNVSFSWDSSDTNVATVSPETGRTTTATTIAPGAATIRARAGGQADTSALTVNPVVASVELNPPSASVPATSTRTFTATARDGNGNVTPGITFTFSLRNASPANAATITGTTSNTVTVRGVNQGSVTVVASYTRPNDGVALEDTSALTITAPPPRVTSIEVSPSSATINRGQTQQFTVAAFNGSTPVSGVTYTWTSNDPNVATVDQNGLATGVGIGTSVITATAPDGLGGTVSDTSTLNVQVPLVINEILADPPAGITGDSNRDGTTNTDDDEFIELVNNSNAPVDLSGVVVSDSTTNRFTFPAGTTLAANQAAVIFGGGSPNASDPNFGGALIFTTSSLGLNNTGDTVSVKLAVGGTNVVVVAETYGSNGGNDQSLTRSPDLTGAFEHHTTATNSAGRRFSPGTRLDGTPFGSPAITRIEVTPATASAYPGDTQQFTATAFSNAGGPEIEVPNVSFYWTSSDPTTATVSPTTGQGTTATAVAAGTATVSALAGGQASTATLTVNAVVATIELAPASASVAAGNSQVFTATARDSGGNVITGLTFSFSLRDASPANAATITGTTANTVTVRGDQIGSATVVVNYTRPNDNVTLEDTSLLTITAAAPQVDHVEVSPAAATINRGQTQQFTATAFDSSNQPVPGATFAWTSSATNVATIDANGLATGVGIGTTTITAETSDGQGGTASGTATLNVQVPLVINEILADVAPDNAATTDIVEGDANRDLVRNADDDEFVELLNNSNAPVDLSGVVISDAITNRFTFPAGTTLAAGRAVLVFGGGTPPTTDPAFGGALILTTSSLGLNDAGDTVTVKLSVGGTDVQIDQVAFGGANPAPAPSDQSLTRSPDAEIGTTGGGFVAHNTATNAHNRVFSPGTRLDGTPFGSPAITRIEVTPASPAIEIGDKQTFTGKAFSNVGGPEVEVPNVSFFWTSGNTSVATVAPLAGQTTEATAHAFGSSTITAFAGGQNGTATLTVNAPPPSLSIDDVSMTEGDAGTKNFTFTIQLSGPAPAGGVTFDIATADDTATDADNDYEPNSATSATIPATQTSYQFTVAVNGDVTIEPNEAFFVNVTSVSGATVSDAQGVGTIQNDDSPTLSINDVTSSEGDAGTTTFTFTVHSSIPAPAGGIAFDISTADGTAHDDNPASEDNDYAAKSLTNQTIPEGAQDYTFDVSANGDTTVEPNETFSVNVTNVSGATIGDGQGLGTIQNDDAADLVISQIYPGGGNAGATYTHDFIELFNQGTTTIDFSVTPYSVQYAGATANFGAANTKTNITTGTIGPGQYFLIEEAAGANPGTSTMPTPDLPGGVINLSTTAGKVALVVGTTAFTGTTCPGDDGTPPFNPNNATIVDLIGYGTTANCYEGSGPAPFSTSTAGGLDPDARSTVRKAGGCQDTNDNAADFLNPTSAPVARNTASATNSCVAGPAPNLTINDVTAAEGNSGATIFTFTVSLSAPAPSTDVFFDIATQNGTATTANSDYVARPTTTQVIPAGQQTFTFNVTVNGDAAVEPDETFFVNVTNVTGANLTDGQGVGTIQNDEVPALSINDVSSSEGNSGTTTYTFTVHLSSPALTGGVQFDISTADNTATDADNDYEPRSLTSQTIAAGNQDYTFDVTVNGDMTGEANETFFVNVTNVSGASLSDAQGVGTIQNDDSQPSFSIDDVTHMEGNSGTTSYVFTVSKTGATAFNSSVQFQTVDGTATLGDSDYQNNTGTLTFLPADTTMQITVLVNGDTTAEPDETFTVQLFGATGATISDNTGAGTIQNDDSPPAPLVVTKTADTDDQLCDADCSLREAVFAANSLQDADTISFQIPTTDPGYNSTTGVYTITLTSAISITADLTINGLGANVLTISGNQANRIFSTPTGVALTLDGMTIRDAAAGPTAGAISNSGTMTISNCILTQNSAAGGGPTVEGGAITNSGTLTISYSTLSNNSASSFVGKGGAISNSGTLTIIRSTLSGNTTHSTSSGNGSASYGGAIFNSGSNAVVNLINSTLSGNSAVGGSSTPFGGAQAFGGAIYNAASGQGVVRLTNCTLSGNFVTGGDIAAGGGIYNGGGVVSGRNTIIAQGISSDVFGPFESQGHNIIANTSGATITNSNPYPGGDKFDAAASPLNLGPLQNNGGPTETRALGAGSVAIDAGDDCVADAAHCGDANIPQLAFDQRGTGFPRKVDGDGNSTATVDIGAYEVQTPYPSISIDDVTHLEGNTGTQTYTFTVHLSQPAPAGGVTFDIATQNNTAVVDDGNPATISDNDYVGKSLTSQTIPEASQNYQFTVTVNGDKVVEPTESFFVNVTNVTGATVSDGQGVGTIQNDDTPDLVISQIYPGGGNAGATYTNDFIEIFNQGTTTIDFSVTNYSVQYAGATANFGAANTKTNIITGTIGPGQYFLIQEATGGANGVALPTPDASGNIAMSATAGKVALVSGTTAFTGTACPGDDGNPPFNPNNVSIVDFVGYGTTANCYEGSGPAPFSTSIAGGLDPDARSTIRTSSCTDTNNNSSDFSNPTTAPTARNKSTPPASCP
jgi:CSLREA domain-containing protein